ncbi:MAG: ATP/GTP-binding protein [Promethearchaeota archaeon]
MKKDTTGRIHFKIVFYGPSPSGKTTSLKWIHENVEGYTKSGFTSVDDPNGFTLYFDYTTLTSESNVIFDVYTVAGQKRHKHQRNVVLKGTDGIVFVVDSSRKMMPDNKFALEELRGYLGSKQLDSELPMVVMLNKRDAPDSVTKKVILSELNLEKYPAYETIATKGIGIKSAFTSLAREILSKNLHEIDDKQKIAS